MLCKDVIARLRETIVCKTCAGAKKILSLPDDVFESVSHAASLADEHRILRTIEIFSEAEGAMRYSVSPKILLECACIKASEPSADYNIDALLGRISALEKALAEGGFERKSVGGNVSGNIGINVGGTAVAPAATGKAASAKTEFMNAAAEKPTVKSAEEKPAGKAETYNDYMDEGIPIPPPEDEYEVEKSAYKSINEQKSAQSVVKTVKSENDFVEKKEPQAVAGSAGSAGSGFSTGSAEQGATKQKADAMSAGKIWGTVVRKLRAEKQIVLWIACQEMTAKLYGKTLRVAAADEAGYNAVTKAANLETLSKIVKSVGDYDIEIVKSDEEEKDGFEKDVDEVKKTFGADVVKVED